METNQDKNVGFEFLKVAGKHPDHIAFMAEDTSLTYSNMKSVVEAFAFRMQAHGVDQHSVVIVDTSDLIASLSSLLASALLGARFAYANVSLAKAHVIKATHFFATTEAKGQKNTRARLIDETWAPHIVFENNSPIEDYDGYTSPDAPWLTTHTSGTTGFPKFMSLSQKMVFDRSMASRTDYIPFETRFAPLFTCMARPFVSRALSAILSPCTIVDSRNLEFWNEVGVNLVVGSPEQVKDILGGTTLKPKIPVLHVGGGKFEDAVAAEMLSNFEQVVDLYGASETNRTFKNIKSLDAHGNVSTKGQRLDSEIEIVDDLGQVCGIDEVGVVRVKNPYLAKGYLNNVDAEKRSFIEGWFYPGDTASWGLSGDLKIEGRVDDVINLGGTKINALIPENVLRMVKGVDDAICFKNPRDNVRSELIAFVVFEPLTLISACIEKAQKFCYQNVPLRSVPTRIFPIDEIPIRADGRPDRKKCEEIVLQKLQDRKIDKA